MSEENQAQETQVPVTAAGGPVVVPDYLKNMMGGQNAAADSMASASMSIPRVSMRGKKFRFNEGGEEVETFNDRVAVSILGVEPGAGLYIKTYYAKPYQGANSADPPDCASDDGVVPGNWVPNKQNPVCATCPQNRFGSATSRTGKPAKACRDSKRLWIKLAKEAHDPEATVYALQVTVMSLKNLSVFGRKMKDANVPISAAVVEIVMDDDSEFPMIDFNHVGYFKEEIARSLIELGNKAPWKMGQISPQAAITNQPQTLLPGQPAPTGPHPSQAQVKQEIPQQQAPVQNLQAAGNPNVQSSPPAVGDAKPGNMSDIIQKW